MLKKAPLRARVLVLAARRENNPNFGKNHTEETRTKISPSPHLGGFGMLYQEKIILIMEKICPMKLNQKYRMLKRVKILVKKLEKKYLILKKAPLRARVLVLAARRENNPNSQQIEVIDLKEITTTYYNSFREAARALNIPNHCIISNYIKNNQKKPYKGRYTFKKINS